MGLNKEIAARLADARLAEWRRVGYGEWRAMLDDKDVRQVVGEDGKRYSVVSYAGDGCVRMSVAVDDGGWSAFVPLVRDEIMKPDGTFVE
ncbi:hypothetical protein DLE60_07430 [Micromonospora globispora]|uniref:Uncharacterized protein n=1 Tax=Micromonospora globispora TaxID=1450148 RepID=A0A317KGY4_9ACTN|nr:hypothetical protein [Micromonospora globispora]PWU52863.1 hypothetical protein DLJ46_02250 [Micromonospora globispora]PWU61117.1 hypothetical protein DLE60_07430 [Micromonospora globispora]RQW86570.1 hypothetical protein DKL51_27445 [Micromonospora globispora]